MARSSLMALGHGACFLFGTATFNILHGMQQGTIWRERALQNVSMSPLLLLYKTTFCSLSVKISISFSHFLLFLLLYHIPTTTSHHNIRHQPHHLILLYNAPLHKHGDNCCSVMLNHYQRHLLDFHH